MAEQSNTIEGLMAEVQEFCEVRDWDQFHGPKDLAIGLITEASELLEIFRFKSEEECKQILSNTESKTEVEEEVADCLFMLLRFCQMHNVDLVEAFNKKMKKNNQRYPEQESKGSNVKYSKRESASL